jgi:hypothetical protein
MNRKLSPFDLVCAPLFTLKGVEASTSYGTPALKFKKTLFVRLREDGNSIVIRIDLADRDRLLRDRSDVFFLTDHYIAYPYVLAHLRVLEPEELYVLLKPLWESLQPKRK